jgi:hypothetical protein
MTPHVNCYYQHHYGGLYIVSDVAKSSVDGSKWVVYNHVYPFQYETIIRPYDEWCDGRFRQLEPGEYDIFIRDKDRMKFQDEIKEAKAAANDK